MEAVIEHFVSGVVLSLPLAMEDFFARFSGVDTYDILLFHLFKAWVCQEEVRKLYGEEELALFCDQLINLVAAAEQLHQGNRVCVEFGKGDAR